MCHFDSKSSRKRLVYKHKNHNYFIDNTIRNILLSLKDIQPVFGSDIENYFNNYIKSKAKKDDDRKLIHFSKKSYAINADSGPQNNIQNSPLWNILEKVADDNDFSGFTLSSSQGWPALFVVSLYMNTQSGQYFYNTMYILHTKQFIYFVDFGDKEEYSTEILFA